MTKKPIAKKTPVKVDADTSYSPAAWNGVEPKPGPANLIGELWTKIESCGLRIKKLEIEKNNDQIVVQFGKAGRVKNALIVKATFDLSV